MDFKNIELKKLLNNDGQIEGLPANPRTIIRDKVELLKKNITDYPELLEMRGLIVYPLGDKFVIIGGNMRARALKQLGYKTAPCYVVPADTPAERLKAYTILDNAPFGSWDWDSLANDWEPEELEGWGVDIPDWSGEEENESEEKEKTFIVEIPCNDKDEQNDIITRLEELGLVCKGKTK